MSSSYSANQYEDAFKSHRLQNWTLPKHFKERPSALEGHTSFIATDQGHLFPGVKRGSAWTSFQGTWDLPRRLPPVHINPTARSQEGQDRLKAWGLSRGPSRGLVQSASDVEHREAHVGSRASSRASDKKNTNVDEQHEEQQDPVSSPDLGQEPMPEKPMSPQSHAESRPASKQNQAKSRSASQQQQVGSRPQTQASQAHSRPVSQTSRTG